MRSVIAYYILLAGCTLCSGQDKAMLQADRDFVQAAAGGDASSLGRLLDSEFTWTDSQGRTLAKSELLRNIPKPAISTSDQAETKSYGYGKLGNVQANSGRAHTVRVWVKRPDGWKAIAYQEVMSLAAPPTVTPSAGKGCENPCKGIPYQAKSDTERAVSEAYSKLETAAMARNSAVFAVMVGDEFVAASSNSNKLYDKRGRMDDFDHSKTGGVAPTPLTSAQMFVFGDAVLMRSQHKPEVGKPLHVTRVWVKRAGRWMETLSYQTSVSPAQ